MSVFFFYELKIPQIPYIILLRPSSILNVNAVIWFLFLVALIVVKQRLQMYNSPFRSITECAIKVYQTEGFSAFYRSYGTQLAMNVPFQCVHFIVYEAMQNATNPERTYNPLGHVVSGGVSGALILLVLFCCFRKCLELLIWILNLRSPCGRRYHATWRLQDPLEYSGDSLFSSHPTTDLMLMLFQFFFSF